MINSLLNQVKGLSNVGANDLNFLIERFSPDWELWEHIPRLTLVKAVTLSCDFCPEHFDDFVFSIDTKIKAEDFLGIASIELARRLRIAEASYNTVEFGGTISTLPIPLREISTHLFYEWAKSKGWELPARFPKAAINSITTTNISCPWGTHNTKLLNHLSEAAIKFWRNYDQTQPDTAPKNEVVSSWLRNKGVSKTLAEAMATILRADGLRTGRR